MARSNRFPKATTQHHIGKVAEGEAFGVEVFVGVKVDRKACVLGAGEQEVDALVGVGFEVWAAAHTIDAKPGDRFKRQRDYPKGDLFAAITGYFTLANGATQIERKFNDVLSGRTSSIQSIVNLATTGDNSGNVVLTIRSDYQELAAKLLGHREGSIVMMDPRTGAVKALYSWPSYDPNIIADHNAIAAAAALTKLGNDPRDPLLANAYQQRYMPGSTFKMVTTTSALKYGIADPDTVFARENSYLPPQTDNPIQNYGGHTCGGDLPDRHHREAAGIGLLF